MSETTRFPEPPWQAPSTSASPPRPPYDILLQVIAAFLAPMFRGITGGDIQLARMAALETLSAYRARDHADLIAIAQIIACGLSALGSLSLAMADDLSLNMTLRLRANAAALNRAAEQNRRVLTQKRAEPIPSRPPDCTEAPFAPADAIYEAEVLAKVAAAQKLTAEAHARLHNVEPPITAVPTAAAPPTAAPPAANHTPALPSLSPSAAPPAAANHTPAPPPVTRPTPPIPAIAASHAPTPPAGDPAVTEQELQSLWASAMSDVAAEFAAAVENLPPEQRRQAAQRAAVLSECAGLLVAGDVPPRPRPGDLAALMLPSAP